MALRTTLRLVSPAMSEEVVAVARVAAADLQWGSYNVGYRIETLQALPQMNATPAISGEDVHGQLTKRRISPVSLLDRSTLEMLHWEELVLPCLG